jgi:hypothetical protein
MSAVAIAITLAVTVGTGAAALGWLVYQPVKADLLVYQYYRRAVGADPAHAGLYQHAYGLFARHTASNGLHFVVHEAAARLATITGHHAAAQTQRSRAAYHYSPRIGRALDVLSGWLRRVKELAQAPSG